MSKSNYIHVRHYVSLGLCTSYRPVVSPTPFPFAISPDTYTHTSYPKSPGYKDFVHVMCTIPKTILNGLFQIDENEDRQCEKQQWNGGGGSERKKKRPARIVLSFSFEWRK